MGKRRALQASVGLALGALVGACELVAGIGQRSIDPASQKGATGMTGSATGMTGSAAGGAGSGGATSTGACMGGNAASSGASGASKWPDSATAHCADDKTALAQCPMKGATAYGQDGSYQLNVPSYAVSMSGAVVLDSVTGLKWQRQVTPGAMTYADAVKYCGTQQLDAATGWRLPTLLELFSIVDYGRYSPAITPSFTMPPSGEQFWTSTPSAATAGNRWVVHFADGGATIDGEQELNPSQTRCVLGPGLAGKLTVDQQVVHDSRTQLTWQKAASSMTFTWLAAIDHCEKLVLQCHDDWRLASIKELVTLIDETQKDSVLLPQLTGTSRQWSSTPTLLDGDAWLFDPDGIQGIGIGKMTSTNIARCVRGP